MVAITGDTLDTIPPTTTHPVIIFLNAKLLSNRGVLSSVFYGSCLVKIWQHPSRPSSNVITHTATARSVRLLAAVVVGAAGSVLLSICCNATIRMCEQGLCYNSAARKG